MSRQRVSHNDSNVLKKFLLPIMFHTSSQVQGLHEATPANTLTSLQVFHTPLFSFSYSSFCVFLFYLSLGIGWGWGGLKQRAPSSGYVRSIFTSAIGLPFARFQTYSFGITRNVKNFTKAPVYKFLHVPCDSVSNLPRFHINREEETKCYIRKFSTLLQHLSPQHSVPNSVE